LALQKYGYLRKIAKNACSCLPAFLAAGRRLGFFLKKSAAPQALPGWRRPAGQGQPGSLQGESTEEVQQLLIFIFLRELSAAQKFLRK
jgi:hypothetical protein